MNNTPKQTRGILIDPHAKTVTAIIVEGETPAAMYEHLNCSTVDLLRLGEFDGVEQDLWIDDEGVFAVWDKQAFFTLADYPRPLAGRGLVFASNKDGDTVSTALDPDMVASLVQWVDSEGVVIPAPRMTIIDADGSAGETTLLAGFEKWTYADQP